MTSLVLEPSHDAGHAPCILGENAPGGQFYQWLCITGPHYSTVAASLHHCEGSHKKPKPPAPAFYPEGKISMTRAAEILGCKVSRLSDLCKMGRIPCERIGRFVFLETEDVRRYKMGSGVRRYESRVENAAKARAARYKVPQSENLGGYVASDGA